MESGVREAARPLPVDIDAESVVGRHRLISPFQFDILSHTV